MQSGALEHDRQPSRSRHLRCTHQPSGVLIVIRSSHSPQPHRPIYPATVHRLGPPPVRWEGGGGSGRGSRRAARGVLHGSRFRLGGEARGVASRAVAREGSSERGRSCEHPDCYGDVHSSHRCRARRHGRGYPGRWVGFAPMGLYRVLEVRDAFF